MVTYKDPTGKTLINIDIDFIVKLLNEDSDYWQRGSAESSLTLHDDKGTPLMFYKLEKYGIFIMDPINNLSPYKKEDKIELVSHNISGVDFISPSCCYFSIQEAVDIFTSFINNEAIVDIDDWKDIYAIIDEYGFEYDEDDFDNYGGYQKYFDENGDFKR